MIVAKLPSSLPESSSKLSSALISVQEHSAPPLYFVLFTFEASHESQLQSRTGQRDHFIPTKKCWFSHFSSLCRAPYESLADEMSAASSLKEQITYLGTANGILSPSHLQLPGILGLTFYLASEQMCTRKVFVALGLLVV